jgi:hypothetical protein
MPGHFVLSWRGERRAAVVLNAKRGIEAPRNVSVQSFSTDLASYLTGWCPYCPGSRPEGEAANATPAAAVGAS